MYTEQVLLRLTKEDKENLQKEKALISYVRTKLFSNQYV